MEKINFGYSMKNIPMPSKEDYTKRLIEMTEKLVRRMRWKAFHYLNPDKSNTNTETYGFKSRKSPPNIRELQEFEGKMLKLIRSIEFRAPSKDNFQVKLRNDTNLLKKSGSVFVPADKTTNYYKMTPRHYQDLLDRAVTKDYKKARITTKSEINSEAKMIARSLKIDDRVEIIAPKKPFINLKDHKDNFSNRPQCRLINATKPELGKISKRILDGINTELNKKLQFNQWKNTHAVLEWFNNIEDKYNSTFINFDIVNFYPSITESILNNALNFAESYVSISSEDKLVISHARKSLLFTQKDEPWEKRDTTNLFDVPMGSYDGAEVCELVGIYVLSKLPKAIGKQVGLYRDDGLAVLKDNPKKVEDLKKKICNVFSKIGLQITIEANKKTLNFLDVTLNLQDGTHKPYNKPGNIPLYINKGSNHPPSIIANIPLAVNRRLSNLSTNEECFNSEAPVYQKALEESGYNHVLKFEKERNSKRKRTRQRDITWFNPPYAKNITTNIGKKFLNIIDSSFKHDHPLYKIFNRNKLKLSYSCMANMKNAISAQNSKELKQPGIPTDQQRTKQTCNCRLKDECPLQGNCLTNQVVYQAAVQTTSGRETYIGIAATDFKARYRNHTMSFRNSTYKNSTELSKHVWQLKDRKEEFNITWKILRRANAYNPSNQRCNLCLTEKLLIISNPSACTLNRRNEMVSSCRHSSKYLLSNIK